MFKFQENQIFVYALVILSMLFWGMSFVWSTIVFRYYSPVTTVFLRLLISSAFLFLIVFIVGKQEKIKKEDWKLFLLSAFFNPFIYFIGESYGLKLTSSTISAVIIATIPLFAPIGAYYFLKEKLTKLNFLGLFLSFAGIVIILASRDFGLNASPWGVLLLFVAVFSAIVYAIMLKKLSEKYSAFFIVAVQNIIGAIFFSPYILIFDFQKLISVELNSELLFSLVALAVLCSSLAFVFFTISTRKIGVSKTNVFANLIPVFTAIFSYFILAEHFSFQKIGGMALVIFGVFLSQVKLNSLPFGGRSKNNL
jgi:drug/metabolite transporter (DMT)-like permease